MSKVRLDRFRKRENWRGRSVFIELLWIVIQAMFVSSFLPFNQIRVLALRAFGAKIGTDVVIKPGVRVKFPWKLDVGDYTWIGENVWIDNLDEVRIGAHCCISQGAYLCTGSHDWSIESFDLIAKPIILKEGSWLGAFSKVAPGVVIGEGAVLSMGSVATKDLAPWYIYSGNPADKYRERIIKRN